MRNIRDDSGRILNLFWEGSYKECTNVSIEIRAKDRKNLLSDVSQMISSTGTNITGSRSDTVNGIATFIFTLDITSTSHLNTVMQQPAGSGRGENGTPAPHHNYPQFRQFQA